MAGDQLGQGRHDREKAVWAQPRGKVDGELSHSSLSHIPLEGAHAICQRFICQEQMYALRNSREDVDCNNASRLWFVTSIVRQLKLFFFQQRHFDCQIHNH